MATPTGEIDVDSAIQAMADALGRELSARCVILFGSRARGDYQDYSDVDLAVIVEQPAVGPQERYDLGEQACRIAKAVSRELFTRYDIHIWTDPEYRAEKRSINHVAGRSWREGKVLYGFHETLPGEEVGSEIGHAFELLAQARGQIETMGILQTRSREEDFGFHAGRAVELTLKAWIALTGRQYPLTHQLTLLLNLLQQTGADDTGQFRHLASLTNYAVIYQYRGIPAPTMDREWVADEVRRLADHVSALAEQAEAG